MILAVDIGNTTIGIAVLRKGRVLTSSRVETNTEPKTLKQKLHVNLKSIKKKYPEIRVAMICSVVPSAVETVQTEIDRVFEVKVRVIGKDIAVPIPNRYRKPSQVGQDRLVGAFAAGRLYGTPAIVIDLGTAITFDVVSKKGEYLGGAIVPGIRLSVESLYNKTALLPKIEIKAPAVVIGRTTEESILSGIFFGYGALCQGFIERIAATVKGNPKVIMTGGHTRLMKKFIDQKIRIIDEDLVYKGLDLLVPKSYRQESN